MDIYTKKCTKAEIQELFDNLPEEPNWKVVTPERPWMYIYDKSRHIYVVNEEVAQQNASEMYWFLSKVDKSKVHYTKEYNPEKALASINSTEV